MMISLARRTCSCIWHRLLTFISRSNEEGFSNLSSFIASQRSVVSSGVTRVKTAGYHEFSMTNSCQDFPDRVVYLTKRTS